MPFRRIPAGSDTLNVSAPGRNAFKNSCIGNLPKYSNGNAFKGIADTYL